MEAYTAVAGVSLGDVNYRRRREVARSPAAKAIAGDSGLAIEVTGAMLMMNTVAKLVRRALDERRGEQDAAAMIEVIGAMSELQTYGRF